jgi:hypothetical protein
LGWETAHRVNEQEAGFLSLVLRIRKPKFRGAEETGSVHGKASRVRGYFTGQRPGLQRGFKVRVKGQANCFSHTGCHLLPTPVLRCPVRVFELEHKKS